MSETSILLTVALMIAGGVLFGRLAKFCHLPNVTGYIVAGLILGPCVLNLISADAVEHLGIIATVSLGFIAFSIGNEFKISFFKRVGKAPIVIACLESLFAVLFVLLALVIADAVFGLSMQLPAMLVLSAIAAATAPAATIMVIKQYKAKGPMTETLLAVVAIDDATAIMLFGIFVAISQMLTGKSDAGLAMQLLKPIWEIFGALICGFILGLVFAIPLRWFKKDANRLSITIGFIFFALGLADIIGVSDLLMCMAMGAALANFSSEFLHISKLCDGFTPPLFLLFFVASGAELDVSVLPTVGIVGAIYVIFRVVGKYVGSYAGSVMCNATEPVKKYLGPALIPQAGVAIGLSLIATQVVPAYGAQIRAIILCGTLIYELIGPAIAKWSLSKAGEIPEK